MPPICSKILFKKKSSKIFGPEKKSGLRQVALQGQQSSGCSKAAGQSESSALPKKVGKGPRKSKRSKETHDEGLQKLSST